MAAEKNIHSEDIVRSLRTKNGASKLGLVLRSGDNISDSESSSDSEEEDVKVKNGEILVCWYPSGNEEVVPLSKVELVDRSLQPGDVVRHATRPSQKGYVHDIQITADICILGTEEIIKNVNCKKYISPLQPLSQWTYVSLGSWVGYIKKDYRRVVLWLKNGSKCSIEEDRLELFSDALDKRDEDCPFYNSAFYPSQSVVGPAQAFHNAKWLTKFKPILIDQSKIKAIVEEVKVVKLEIVWQVCGSLPPECKKEDYENPPDRIVTEENINKIKVFHQHGQQVQIGDKCFYVVKEDDILGEGNMNQDENKTSNTDTPETSEQRGEDHTAADGMDSCNTPSNCERKVLEASCIESEKNDSATSLSQVTLSMTSVTSDFSDKPYSGEGDDPKKSRDSESDDGDIESDGADHSKPKTSKQDPSSKPTTRRRRKRVRHKRNKPQVSMKVKPGDRVCVEIINTKTRADVMWQDGSRETNVDTLDLISIYHIDDHQFFPGYIVCDKRGSTDSSDGVGKYGVVRNASDVDRTCSVRWFSATGKDLGIEDDVSVYDLGEHVDMVFNPGDLVVVMSGSGEEVVENHGVAGQVAGMDPDGYVVVNFAGNGDSEHGRHRPHELYKVESEDEETEMSSGSEEDHDAWETASEDGHTGDEIPYDVNPATIQDSASEIAGQIQDQQASIAHAPEEITSEASEPPESPSIGNVDIEALNNANNLEVQNPSETESEAFLMLSEVPENHHFYEDHFVKTFTADNPRKFMSVIRKEMLLLRSSLPCGILIRGFDNAMELFTVLITGPKDTPYEGGVFLFDIKLPADYPASPPSVFFVSMTTSALNPNLYVDGTVCTSLLGTWSGKDNESWTEKSNILQVLLSIQALILCKEPYYNEAGYEKHKGTVEGVENSRVYNEMAILHLISSMPAAIKTKHPVFDKEIRKHFQKHGQRIIERFKSWLSHSNKPQQNTKSSTIQQNGSTETTSNSSTMRQNDNDVSVGKTSSEIEQFKKPGFPLFPLSKGFCKCLERNLELLCKTLLEEKLALNEGNS